MAATNYAFWLFLRTHGVSGSWPSADCSSELFEVGMAAVCLHFTDPVTTVLKWEGHIPLIFLLPGFLRQSLFTVLPGHISRTQLLPAMGREAMLQGSAYSVSKLKIHHCPSNPTVQLQAKQTKTKQKPVTAFRTFRTFHCACFPQGCLHADCS